jgi:hypothetical protein
MIGQNASENNDYAPKPGTDDLRRYSFFIVDNHIFDDGLAKRIGPSAFTIYAYLIRRAGKKDACWPKYETIGEDCGISERTVSSSIKKLVQARLLQVVRRQYGYVYEILNTRDENFADHKKTSDMQKKTVDLQVLQVPTKEKNTHEEDSSKQTKKIHGISLIDLPEDISSDVAIEFIEHRKLIKKPLTQRAFDRAMKIAVDVKDHRGLQRLKYTPNMCITETIDAGWQGINLEYLYNRASGGGYQKPAEPRRPSPDLV